MKCKIPDLKSIAVLDKCLSTTDDLCYDEEEIVLKDLRKLGYRIIDSGTWRDVAILDKCVLKIAHGEGIISNKVEINTWNRYKGTVVQQYLNKIDDASPLKSVLAVPRADTRNIRGGTAERFDEDLAKLGYCADDSGPHNLGRVNNRLVLIDYGGSGYRNPRKLSVGKCSGGDWD